MLRSVNSEKIAWIDIQSPNKKDIDFLQQNFHFHPLVLSELAPPSYRSKVENYDEYLFIVIHFPFFDKRSRENQVEELDIIVTRDRIVTSHDRSVIPLKALFDKINLYDKEKQSYLGQNTGYLLYHILLAVLQISVRKIRILEEETTKIEKQIFQGQERLMVGEISRLKRDVIDVKRILAPQKKLFQSLSDEGTKFWGEELSFYFDSLYGIYSEVWDSLQDQKETLSSLAVTNESLLSAKTNDIISALTILTAMSLPVLIVSSVWSMPTDYIPFLGMRGDFWIVMGIIAIGELLTYYILRIKKWI